MAVPVLAPKDSSTADSQVSNVHDLKNKIAELYQSKIKLLEDKLNYCEEPVHESTFKSDPIVLLIGPYSSGKTSCIKHLIQEQLKSMLIGPEPTTEGFDVYSYAENDNELVGELALSDARYPFDMLRSFPQSFKNRFRVQETRNESLKGLILIDSPGILSGSKNLNREYDITEVIKNLASIAFKIVVLFDVTKVDIPDELKQIIQPLATLYPNKLLLALNKCHTQETIEMLRISSSLSWQLRSAIDTPEMPQIFFVSFTNEINCHKVMKDVIIENMKNFESQFSDLGKNNTLAILNMLLIRIKRCICFLHLSEAIAAKLSFWTKNSDSTKKTIIKSVIDETIIHEVCKTKKISRSEFPPIAILEKYLERNPLSTLPVFKQKRIDELEQYISKIIEMITQVKTGLEGERAKLKYSGEESTQAQENPFLQQDKFSELLTDEFQSQVIILFNSLTRPDESRIPKDEFVKFLKTQKHDESNLARIWGKVFPKGQIGAEGISLKEFGCTLCFLELLNNQIRLPDTIPASWEGYF